MFTSNDPEILRQALNRFEVPMFAVQRNHASDMFTLICVNQAYEAMTGRQSHELEGRTLFDLVPDDLAARLNDHYATCVDQMEFHTHSEPTPIAQPNILWKTTLQPVVLDNGSERVVGTCSVIEAATPEQQVTDAEFFATQAQMQLTQMQFFLESLEHSHDLPSETRGHAAMVSGLARSLSRVLSDMRTATQSRLPTPRSQAQLQRDPKPVERFETFDRLNRCLADN